MLLEVYRAVRQRAYSPVVVLAASVHDAIAVMLHPIIETCQVTCFGVVDHLALVAFRAPLHGAFFVCD